jgi:two-component system response regulator HydG
MNGLDPSGSLAVCAWSIACLDDFILQQESDPMPNVATAVLISADTAVVESCRRSVQSIPGLPLTVVDPAEGLDAVLSHHEVILVLIHIAGKNEATGVVRLLRQAACRQRSVAVLVLSDQHNAEDAWSLLRLGAVAYLSRPFDPEQLSALIQTVTVSIQWAKLCSPAASGPLAPWNPLSSVVPRVSAHMARLMGQIRVVAPRENTVLLTGETGTGKTWLGRLIHKLSPRRAEPFLAINCGALAPELIESEMFGHVKGAFTGADRARVGKFAAAGQGSLLLDEIDALPLGVQAKLLRAVDERVFEPVGSNESVPVRARLIAASNRTLEQEVDAGHFRADLYYRLNVIGFHLPPLRDRVGDIPDLAVEFVAEFASRTGRPARILSPEALRALLDYRWPGNVRELRNAIERAVALCPGPQIEPRDLPEVIARAARRPSTVEQHDVDAFLANPATALPLDRLREKVEIERITQALQRCGNNRLRAAAILGISRRTLYKKLHRYSLGATKTPQQPYADHWRCG